MRGAAALLAAALVVGCASGPERSAESFCNTMRAEKERITAQMDATASLGGGDDTLNVLMGLGASMQGFGELRTYFRKLAETAPDEIRTEAEVVADSYEDQYAQAMDIQTNPLGIAAQFLSLLLQGVGTSGQMQALSDYAQANCGENI